jgi:hypothetical protein
MKDQRRVTNRSEFDAYLGCSAIGLIPFGVGTNVLTLGVVSVIRALLSRNPLTNRLEEELKQD